MVRKSNPEPLTLTESRTAEGETGNRFLDNSQSPLSSSKSPKSPRSPFRLKSKKPSASETESPQNQTRTRTNDDDQRTTPQDTASLPLLQPQTTATEGLVAEAKEAPQKAERVKEQRPARGGFFSKNKATKNSNQAKANSKTSAKSTAEESMSKDTDRPSKVSAQDTSEIAEPSPERPPPIKSSKVTRKPVAGPSRSNVSVDSTGDPPNPSNPNVTKKSKPNPFSLLTRTRSLRDENSSREPSPTDKTSKFDKPPPPERSHAHSKSIAVVPSRPENDRFLKDSMSSSRNPSEDRNAKVRDASREKTPKEGSKLQPPTIKEKESNKKDASSSNQGGGHGFLSNLKTSATKGAGAIHKGLFGGGKTGRSASTTEKEMPVDDEHYVLKVINRPLVEQTRLTRISKRLEDSRDKTEFWMPSFPWRAIDYLNYKGSDVEGLYRVPGSGPQIKKWQRRFDEGKFSKLDIDLFEQDDLYDINIIGSMLKAWLRELPEELFPKSAQDRIARECAGAERVPQQLVDELSNLSPFNYYLLFAITCHLSLLLAHSEKNKMDFRNLCICFQPCMKIDAFCFKFLVCDWRDCWKGCKTEPQYTEQEYMLFDMAHAGPPGSAEGQSSTAVESHDERNVSSSDSSKPSSVSINHQEPKQKAPSKKSNLNQSDSQASMSTISTELTIVADRTPPRKSTEMRPLSPIKPLSPIGFS
ncbi:hypothetical protein HYALB_00002113 [Hymenoscyphus albidus]|uniref:Rho-GAP domain-containing protein n=1 Tax=Hymenoscyphus albidus TaxID=595503 RepID=A0A9N9LP28_9HELO|nr:hypothetical protein HYALB_00002113 [Hymenoscyphus albidus]